MWEKQENLGGYFKLDNMFLLVKNELRHTHRIKIYDTYLLCSTG